MNGIKGNLEDFVKEKNFFRKRKFKKIVKSNSNGNIIGNDLYRIFSFRKNKNISSKQNNELTNSNSSFMKKIKEFFHEVKKEISKVKWPSRKDMVKYTITTVLFVIFFALLFFI